MTREEMRDVAWLGIYAGVATLGVSAIGMVKTFNDRDLIAGLFTLGQLLLFSAPALAGYFAARRHAAPEERGKALLSGALAGFMTALPVILLIAVATVFPTINNFAENKYGLINVTPALVELLTFGLGAVVGSLALAAVMAALGLLSAFTYSLPANTERPLVRGLTWLLIVALLSEAVIGVLRPLLGNAGISFFFDSGALRPFTAVIIFVLIAGIQLLLQARGAGEEQENAPTTQTPQSSRRRTITIVLSAILLLLLPFILGRRLTDVVDTVGLFVMMGLGLNIVVGFAGLLDLGYVAFYAIGAYMMGILTAESGLGLFNLNFWVALPFCVAASVIAGVLLGTPVLRMRGDYLAIVTLGFGEIIRVLAKSDVLKPLIGGAQGILQIPKPLILTPNPQNFGINPAVSPQDIYYVILAGCLLALFVSWRLRDARLGRQWMALREDEDVAEAMGINLVKTKLFAFGIGAAFAGLAGAIFAARIGSIFPHSFDLLISINVLSLIIVGGIGSLPGVIVGAFALVGLPELLREFEAYRLLVYGALLIVMMIARPEGLWPSPVRQRELHERDELDETFASEPGENPFTDEPMAEQIAESPNTAVN